MADGSLGRPPRIGIVGAGRRRNGLGPFLADAFEAAGCRITGVAGRDRAGAERAAAELGARLGHAVAPFATAHELAQRVDLLVVASPVAAHLDGVLAAHAAGVACLCEKPFVDGPRTADGLALVAAFRARGLLLAENCQWPLVLPALHELFPDRRGQPPRRIAMGLGPSGLGRAMVEDSLSHVLSVVQAAAAVDPAGVIGGVTQSDPGPAARHNVLAFTVAAAPGPVAVELHLQHCPAQPRPAWLAVDGCRIDRRIGPGYRLSFAGGGNEVSVQDPLHGLVYRLVALLGTSASEPTVALADSIATRLRCAAAVLAALGPG